MTASKKKLCAAIDRVKEKFEDGSGVVFCEPHKQKARRHSAAAFSEPASKVKQGQGNSTSAPSRAQSACNKSRVQKLQEIAKNDKNKKLNVELPKTKLPIQTYCHTNKFSRADLLISDLTASISQTSSPTQPAEKTKPKATVTPFTVASEIANTNPVGTIFQKMDNNRIEDVLERTTNPSSEQQLCSSMQSEHTRQAVLPSTQPAERLFRDKNASRLAHSAAGKPEQSTKTKTSLPSQTLPGKILKKHVVVKTNSTAGIKRLPEDQVYRDVLSWNTSWMAEQGHKSKPPPVTGDLLVTSNLPVYENYECYKNTFYPLMLHELWASIQSEVKDKDNRGKNAAYGNGNTKLKVALDRISQPTHHCPLLNGPSSQNQIDDRRRCVIAASNSSDQGFYHQFTVTTLVQEYSEVNRDRDFGTLSFQRKNSSGEVSEYTCFVFFSEPNYEVITPSTIVPQILTHNFGTKKLKAIIPVVAHLRCDPRKIVFESLGTVTKICYLGSSLRSFRALSQLPDSSLFRTILSPPTCQPADVFNPSKNVCRSEMVSSVYASLNTVQQAVVQHICGRVTKDNCPDIMLLHGPPGTGKTRTVVGIILQLTKDYKLNAKDKLRLLVCTPSNAALDEIIRRLVKAAPDVMIVRHGNGQCSEDAKKYRLEDVAKQFTSQAPQLDSVNASISATKKNLEALKSKKYELLKELITQSHPVIASLENDIDHMKRDLLIYEKDLKNIRSDRKQMEQAKQTAITTSQVVFSTLSSCSSGQLRRPFRVAEQDGNDTPLFNCCIVDEATQSTEPECLSPILLGCNKLILVGDPKQLPATVLSAEAESKRFRQSLFARLYNHYDIIEKDGGINPVMMLTIQYRMHPDILKWPNAWFYQNKLKTQAIVNERPALRLKPYVFINIPSQETNQQNGQISNEEEIKFVMTILNTLKRQHNASANHKSLLLGVITPYSEQRRKVQAAIRNTYGQKSSFLSCVEVDTVDSFQGREKDVIIVSCVRSNELGFLKTPERLNVALTRAKTSLIILGNVTCLNVNPMWKSLMDDAVQRECYESIPPAYAEKGEDFVKKWVERAVLLALPRQAKQGTSS